MVYSGSPAICYGDINMIFDQVLKTNTAKVNND